MCSSREGAHEKGVGRLERAAYICYDEAGVRFILNRETSRTSRGPEGGNRGQERGPCKDEEHP
jgi:hypothetical protein